MTHYMNLHSQPFNLIASGAKTIELRLYDEKRRLINLGDTIIFSNSEHPDQTLCVTVKNLYIFPSFTELYDALPLDKCGYLPEELPEASPRDMDIYYSADKQLKYGVIGIEIELFDRISDSVL